MMKATLDLVVSLLTGIALSAASVAAGVLGFCAVAGGGWWWWRRQKGRDHTD